jgi:ferric-dicitrate binding protein FerR (iron transport regulator)
MKSKHTKALGWLAMVAGVLVVIFRESIVFPGFEWLIGSATIIGSENVVRLDDGSYAYTNPAAMIRWVLAVSGIGWMICAPGIFLLFRARSHGAVQ